MARTQDDYARVFRPLDETFSRIKDFGRRGPGDGSPAARDAQTRLGRRPWELGVPAAAKKPEAKFTTCPVCVNGRGQYKDIAKHNKKNHGGKTPEVK